MFAFNFIKAILHILLILNDSCHFYGCFSIFGITLWQQSKIGNNFSFTLKLC